jgi:hypothetical protein
MPNSKPSCPTLVSPNNDKDKSVIDDVVLKGQKKKRRKMYDGA